MCMYVHVCMYVCMYVFRRATEQWLVSLEAAPKEEQEEEEEEEEEILQKRRFIQWVWLRLSLSPQKLHYTHQNCTPVFLDFEGMVEDMHMDI